MSTTNAFCTQETQYREILILRQLYGSVLCITSSIEDPSKSSLASATFCAGQCLTIKVILLCHCSTISPTLLVEYCDLTPIPSTKLDRPTLVSSKKTSRKPSKKDLEVELEAVRKDLEAAKKALKIEKSEKSKLATEKAKTEADLKNLERRWPKVG